MSKTIYGVIDIDKDVYNISDTTDDKNLYDTYCLVNELLIEFNSQVKTSFNERENDDEREFDEFEDDYIDEYCPDSSYDDYADLSNKVDLKDIGFNEKVWQNIMIYFDHYTNFPAKNLCIISVEESNKDSLQRVDLLYLRSDGRIIPAEIKVSDNGRDAHGQIIRYMAGFSDDTFTIDTILDNANKKIPSNIKHIEKFIDNNSLYNKQLIPIDTSGILICERFHPDTLKAIRYLNEKTNLDIKMFDMDVYVKYNWNKDTKRFIFKIELNEVV